MKRGLILAGLGCVLLCAAVVFVLRGRSRAPERAGFAAQSTGIDSPTREALEAEGSEPRAQESPANATHVEASREVNPTATVVEFLPYPNEGASDFERKYEGLDLNALAGARSTLRELLNEELEMLAEARYSQGLFDERVYAASEASSADTRRGEPPHGMGDVWPCERGATQPNGSFKRSTTYLTQAESPELFAHKSEYLWVANAYHSKLKHPVGH